MRSGQTSRTFAPRICLVLLAFQLLTFTASGQFTKLLDFNGTNGSEPWGSLISDGTFLYGMTSLGGANNIGTIFKLRNDGSGYVKLFDFSVATGSHPFGSLYYDGTFLYGMTAANGSGGVGSIFKIKPDGTGFLNLLQFNGTNGASPYGAFISDGTFLYGLTSLGGSGSSGTVFKIKPDGTGFATLVNLNATVGRFPYGSLFFDGTYLYGMASSGGDFSQGTIFKVKTDGTLFTKIFDFTGASSGSGPQGSLISDGTFLYGMTESGGANNDGCIFKVLPSGTGYVRLTNFNLSTGDSPFGDLTKIGSYFYGLTYSGGTGGTGNLFRVKTDGTGLTTLLDFSNVADGWLPYGSLLSEGGILYGMTQQGGPSDGGAVFKYQLNIVPTITSFAPTNGAVGTTVTITGTNFDPVAANNIVYFGATRASVDASTSTELTVTVPFGATFQPISANVAGLTAYSKTPFLVSFPDGGLINTCSFEAPVFYGSGTAGSGLAMGDLDGDGKTDVVTTDYTANKIHLFRNTSSLGAISATSFAASIDYDVGTTPLRVTIADIDGDAKLDIAVTAYNGNTVSIFRNVSTPGSLTAGSFSARVDLLTAVGSAPLSVVCRDLDGDGKTDITVSNAAHGTISIWRNIGSAGSITSGSFATRLDIAGPGTGLAIEDIDGDGKPDLVGGYNLGTAIGVSRNFSTPGTLSAASFLPFVNFTVSAWPEYIVVGDLDSDNKPDIVTSSWPGNAMSVLKNNSTAGSMNIGSLAPHLVLIGTAATEPRGVALSDFDGDGLLDIGLSKQTGVVEIYRNANTPGAINTGSFLTPVAFGSTGGGRDLQSGDIDGDGKPELITANFGSQSFSVMRNIVRAGPTVSGFSPASGSVGSTVTITGTNFSTTLSDNVVNFNGTAGFVIGATTTSLTVVVPPSAFSGPISVRVNCNGPVASAASFTVTPIVYNTCSYVNLNGTSDYIQVANNPTLEPASITIEALINFAVAPTFNVIVAMPDGTPAGDAYAVWWEGGALRAGVRLGPSLVYPWTPVLGQWYHIALTYNSATNSEILYLDGDPLTAGTSLNIVYNNQPLLIGGDINFGSHDGFFNGKIDEVRIWNLPRTQVELLTNLTSSLTGSEPGLVAYYRINESGAGAGIAVPNSATATGAVNNGVTFGSAATPVFQGSCSCVPVAERNALIALYNSTGGASWTNKTNWLNPDVGTWAGVVLSGCHVFELQMDFNNMVGPIPPEIGDLTELEHLSLSSNQLNGTLPDEITNLTNLEYLFINNNQFSGPLPATMGNMTSLIGLETQINAFTGPLPASLANCTQLRNLHLQENQHTGSIPAFLGSSLFNLQVIDLSFNLFDGNIPASLGNLANLNFLSLAGNQLTGNIPNQLGLIDELELLDLSQNQLSGTIPIALGNLSSLQSLQLWSNQLDDDIPDEIGNLSNLQEFNVEQNFLTGDVPGTFSNLTQLRVLNVANNSLVLVDTPVGSLPALEVVNLANNGILSVIPTFTSPGITQLAVENNNLDFADLEPNIGVAGFTYVPQNRLNPGGVINVPLGGTLTIPFTANGTANSYQWYRGGEIIPGATSLTLVKPGMTTGDVGFYTIRITNSIVTGLTLESQSYMVTTGSCPPGPRDAGDLDLAFSPLINTPSNFLLAGTQSDGKILAGTPSTIINAVARNGLLRFNPDGSLDSSFPVNSFGPPFLVQPDDKIVVTAAGDIARLLANGTVDPTFNAGGVDNIYITALQPDGKILYYGDNDGDYFLGRLNLDGSDDSTFPQLLMNISAIEVQADGGILLGGPSGDITRLLPSGAVDPGFNSGADDEIKDIAVQPDGKILVTGLFIHVNGEDHYGIVRLNADGTTDTSFNLIGLTDDLELGLTPYKIAVQTDGKVVLAGNWITWNGADRRNLVRLNSDGSVDCGFDPGLSSNAPIEQMMLQADGNILIAGIFTSYDGTTRNGLARVNDISSSTITITAQPVDATVCEGILATFTTAATGTTNITFQWQYSVDGVVPFADVVNGGGYSNATTSVLSVNTTGSFGMGRYRCRINGDLAPEVITFDEGLFINALPAAPGTTGNSGCPSTTILLSATGAVNGQYRWYTVSTGGTSIAGQLNSTYLTPALSTTTTYFAAINNGTCESTRTAVVATVLAAPSTPTALGALGCGPSASLTLNASGALPGQYRWYTLATGGSPIAGETNSSYVTPALTSTTTFFVSINNGICESLRVPVEAQIRSCTPIIAEATAQISVGSTVSINIALLVTIISDPIDLSSIKVIVQPTSGAVASIVDGVLDINYSGVSFAGIDHLTIEACDLAGHCAQKEVIIEVAGDITIFNAISPNGDGKNDTFIIQYIEALPETQKNKVTIFNRWGTVVYEVADYNNSSNVFKGLSKSGEELPSGTYYYTIEFSSGATKRNGFISLRR